MEGYSVTEAASILGVPTERVWELLARGVLSGAPEGETGMRVYLQPRPAPAPPVPEASRPNGDAGSAEPSRELSPFRELLTEFRNLTERYGQALLALGEARGEVAALRSRVDLLEARMDLRLPMTAGPMTPPTPWPTPMPVAPTPAADDSTAPHDAQEEESEGERRRRRGARRATESFAEALARAEDPTRPELPDAAETAAALAALRDEPVDSASTEAILPRELPAAEPMPLADERDFAAQPVVEAEFEPVAEAQPETKPEPVALAAPDEPVGLAEQEPEMVSEAEPVGLAEQEPEMVSGAEPESEPTAVVEAEFEPVAEVQPEPEPVAEVQPEPEPVAVAEAAHEPELVTRAEPGPEPATEPEAAAAADSELAPAPAAGPVTAAAPEADVSEPEPIAWDPERYTVEIVEPDWYAEEEPAQPDAQAAAPEAASVDEIKAQPETEPDSASEAAPELPEPEPAPEREPDSAAEEADEETMLWFGRTPPTTDEGPDAGADEIEVVGATRRTGPSPLPGSQELDDALAALDALAPPDAAAGEGPDSEQRANAGEASAAEDESWPPAVRSEAAAVPAPTDEPERPTGAAGSLTSLTRPSTTPATTRAYRRLRRIFPG